MYKKGKVKWFDLKKGFGFLMDGEGHDAFVHFSTIVGDGFKTLKDGDEVIYFEADTPKGRVSKKTYRVADLTPEKIEELMNKKTE